MKLLMGYCFSAAVKTALCWLGKALGYIVFIWSLIIIWPMKVYGKSGLGRHLFVLGSRTRFNPRLIGLLVLPLILGIDLVYDVPFGVAFAAAGLTLVCMLLNTLVWRVLTITNLGLGRWELHLNVQKRNAKPSVKWAGAALELSEVTKMAVASEVRPLSFESPLLVCNIAARHLTGKLVRAFAEHGIRADAKFSDSRSLGPFKTGLYHPLRHYQSSLKSHRVVFDSSVDLLTRRIELHITQG